jgi:hypothetical protein
MNERKPAKKSLLSKIISIFFGSLIVVMLAFEGYGLISARSNYGVPNFFGYQFLVIQTDSMDTGPDTFPVNMGIIVQKVAPETLVASTNLKHSMVMSSRFSVAATDGLLRIESSILRRTRLGWCSSVSVTI